MLSTATLNGNWSTHPTVNRALRTAIPGRRPSSAETAPTTLAALRRATGYPSALHSLSRAQKTSLTRPRSACCTGTQGKQANQVSAYDHRHAARRCTTLSHSANASHRRCAASSIAPAVRHFLAAAPASLIRAGATIFGCALDLRECRLLSAPILSTCSRADRQPTSNAGSGSSQASRLRGGRLSARRRNVGIDVSPAGL